MIRVDCWGQKIGNDGKLISNVLQKEFIDGVYVYVFGNLSCLNASGTIYDIDYNKIGQISNICGWKYEGPTIKRRPSFLIRMWRKIVSRNVSDVESNVE